MDQNMIEDFKIIEEDLYFIGFELILRIYLLISLVKLFTFWRPRYFLNQSILNNLYYT